MESSGRVHVMLPPKDSPSSLRVPRGSFASFCPPLGLVALTQAARPVLAPPYPLSLLIELLQAQVRFLESCSWLPGAWVKVQNES